MQLTRKCAGCKNDIKKTELKEYKSPSGKTTLYYCEKCYAEKMERLRFSDKVCQIFRIKSPGPQIWTERGRLISKYGFDDNTIINCLDFLYNIRHVKQLTESLYLVTPTAVEQMRQWERTRENKGSLLQTAFEQSKTIKEHVVKREKKEKTHEKSLNADDFLEE